MNKFFKPDPNFPPDNEIPAKTETEPIQLIPTGERTNGSEVNSTLLKDAKKLQNKSVKKPAEKDENLTTVVNQPTEKKGKKKKKLCPKNSAPSVKSRKLESIKTLVQTKTDTI